MRRCRTFFGSPFGGAGVRLCLATERAVHHSPQPLVALDGQFRADGLEDLDDDDQQDDGHQHGQVFIAVVAVILLFVIGGIQKFIWWYDPSTSPEYKEKQKKRPYSTIGITIFSNASQSFGCRITK